MTVKSILSKTFPGGLGQWMHGNELDAALGAFDQDKVKASLPCNPDESFQEATRLIKAKVDDYERMKSWFIMDHIDKTK